MYTFDFFLPNILECIDTFLPTTDNFIDQIIIYTYISSGVYTFVESTEYLVDG